MLGIASFVIAFLVGGLDIILAVVVASGIARSAHALDALQANVVAGGMAIFCLNCMSIPLCLVGFGLGFVALVTQRRHNHVFTWIGVLGNGVVIFAVVGFYLFAQATRS